jgi:hypothetical protein
MAPSREGVLAPTPVHGSLPVAARIGATGCGVPQVVPPGTGSRSDCHHR